MTALAGTAGVMALAMAMPASAHVELSPETAAPGQFLVYTVSVPNERDDSATTGVDLKLPAGFVLDAAQSVSGWRTVITKGPDGTPTQVSWTGGRIPVGTFATFQLQGRNPSNSSAITWTALQHYERVDVAWNGKPGSENPAPVVTLSAKAAPAESAEASGGKSAGAVDQLARSRAALAIAVGLAGLLVGLMPSVVAFARRRRLAAEISDGRTAIPDERPAPRASSTSKKTGSGRR